MTARRCRSRDRWWRGRLPRPVTHLLWVAAELTAIATDLAEFLGGAIALNLLFGVPLLIAALITAVVSSALLALGPGSGPGAGSGGRRRSRLPSPAGVTGVVGPATQPSFKNDRI